MPTLLTNTSEQSNAILNNELISEIIYGLFFATSGFDCYIHITKTFIVLIILLLYLCK